ncbi:MAG: mannosyltransferase B-like protein [Candidatus Woesebacteria bacterium GW2011_GWB1_43_14]|uniref:Mannosyltransferase B-like protein n=1 Tax=Candidatus Woesebacteria bacterium GW2011_GWB1_43_14 TaxID=1618578 RepID=A0A0G1DHA5_9BACT|nr:MAG: mannosyltransferase B-like protein [Candidatus Woesebacteria bacterium GW2011_GWA1_39_11b]KKS78342.1 MAG: mannosyltransferase B-like protein [Candidatus Woesebacteria bacterium GW2011_GWC1_42_9]KKS97240.1 MAG: mannosyltransferase B-like protein [Candidatus Woesebacteria bacterium GW2011_GWB1_43_14]
MRVAVDIAPLYGGHAARGMGVYTKNLLDSLQRISSDFRVEVEGFQFSKDKGRIKKYDLVHYPYFDLFYLSLPFVKYTKTVVTVPDVIPLLYPNRYPPGTRGKIKHFLQKKSLNECEAVITLSETSKKDIVRYLGVPEDRVYPIHLAPGFNFAKQDRQALRMVRSKYKLPQHYVLYVGDVNYNKNLLQLIKAVKRTNMAIIIVGKQASINEFDRDHIENLSLKILQDRYRKDKNVIRLGYLEGSEFMSIWQMATVYCQPSLYEGFGLPILEAFQVGLPVVASKIQTHIEIAGDAAVYFDPKNSKDLEEKLRLITNNKVQDKNDVNKGKKCLAKYSWLKTARQTMAIYQKVVNNEKE